MKRDQGWFQRLSERYYYPYTKWWFSWKTNLIFGALALSGLLIFYFLNANS